jgi:mono/diheme cytochrome c family protein
MNGCGPWPANSSSVNSWKIINVMSSLRSQFCYVLFPVVLWLALLKPAAVDSKQAARGRALYLEYCASCHGVTGEGDGPVASALITPPANLRRLAERFGNPLPEDQIERYIDGRAEVKAHGPREMPVWGRRFYYKSGGNERRARQWIAELLAYLQLIQSQIRHASLK